jgi:hypothetical protein
MPELFVYFFLIDYKRIHHLVKAHTQIRFSQAGYGFIDGMHFTIVKLHVRISLVDV